MFRIKPTRNQTTAKHINLSPNPNNQFIVEKKKQQKLTIKEPVRQNEKKQTKVSDINPIKNQINSKVSNNLFVQTKKPLPLNPKISLQKQIINPQRIPSSKQNLLNPSKNVSILSKNSPNLSNKPHERTLLKRSQQHKEHKLKIQTNDKKQTEFILLKPIEKTKNQNITSIVKRKQSALRSRNDDNKLIDKQKIEEVKQQQKRQSIKKSIYLSDHHQKPKHLIQSRLSHHKIVEKAPQIKFQHKIQQKYIGQKVQNHYQIRNHQQIKYEIEKIQQKIKTPPIVEEQKLKTQNEKQKQMQDLVIKIQKRRQARQLQKKRQQQIEQKRKQNEQRALQFLNEHNNRQNVQQIQGVTGMLKLNDQLMHFSLAESIMDLQIKKLLKTNFDQFPNASQIKYQVEQLQRINQSYQLIRDDQSNPLKSGLQNYRVQIFNRIGDLIMKAQQQGYSNPNFHILQHDGRLPQGPNSVIPGAVRGLPEESHKQYIKYVANQQEDQCAICLGEINIGQIVASLQCGHKFHSKCIKQWVKSSANCPTCRFNIKFGIKAK